METINHPGLILECSGEGLRFASGTFQRPLIIHYQHEQIREPESLPTNIGQLRQNDFDFLDHGNIEIVVVGTGAESSWLASDLTAHIQRRGIGIEIAQTRSASYTFNVLLAEGRPVAALMYPPGPARTVVR